MELAKHHGCQAKYKEQSVPQGGSLVAKPPAPRCHMIVVYAAKFKTPLLHAEYKARRAGKGTKGRTKGKRGGKTKGEAWRFFWTILDENKSDF